MIVLFLLLCCTQVNLAKVTPQQRKINNNQTTNALTSEEISVSVNVTYLMNKFYFANEASASNFDKLANDARNIGTVVGTRLDIEPLNETGANKQAYQLVFSVHTNRSTPINSIVTYSTTDYQQENGIQLVISGIYIVKKTGNYLLNFKAIGHSTVGGQTTVELCVNQLARAVYSDDNLGFVSISIVLNLDPGDRIDIFVSDAPLFDPVDDGLHFTQFSGLLLG